jgi:hypothetical protein
MLTSRLLDKFYDTTVQRQLNFPIKRRLFLERLSQRIHKKGWKKRLEFTDQFLASLSSGFPEIPQETGFLIWSPPNLSSLPLLIKEANNAFNHVNLAELGSRTDNQTPNRLNIPWDKPLSLDHPLYQVARDPNILGPITRYLGFLPIINALDILYYPNNQWFPKSTQFFHVDAKSTDQIRVFIHISDVGALSGPTLVFPKNICQSVFENYLGNYPEDSFFEKNLGFDNCQQLVGPSGSIVFFDSGRCFHAGGRPSSFPRLILNIQYVSPAMIQWLPTGWSKRTRFWNLANPYSSPVDKYLLGWE